MTDYGVNMTNNFDPTTNRISFALLTDEERITLKAWPHGFQCHINKWIDVDPNWSRDIVYRGKPAPVVKTKWVTVYGHGALGLSYPSREGALDMSFRNVCDSIGIVRVDVCNGVPTFTFEPISKGE